jgi:hypothetical protein
MVLLVYVATLIVGLCGLNLNVPPAASAAVTAPSTPPTVDDVLLPTAGS